MNGAASDRTAGSPLWTPASNDRLHAYEVALVVLGMLLAASVAYLHVARASADPDMFWHLANGREMATSHSIPQQDNLSWYGAEKRLKTSTQEWLYDLGAFQIYSLGGFGLLYGANAALFGLLFGLVFTLTWLRTARSILSLIIATVSILGVTATTSARPQAVSFILLVLLAIVLEKRWWLAALPIVVAVANIHGFTYPIFIAVIAYYTYREKSWLIIAAIGCVALNPQGLSLLVLPLRGLSSPAGARYIQEFVAPSIRDNWMLFATLIALALLLRNRRMPLDTALFALALACFALMGLRYIPYLYLIGLPLLAPHLRPDDAREFVATHSGTAGPQRWLRVLLIVEMTAAVVVTVTVTAFDARARIDPDAHYPQAAVRYIKRNDIRRVFNHFDEGGYLIFRGVPSLIDGRATQFGPLLNEGEDLFERYVGVLLLRSDYRAFLKQHKIRYVLLPKRAALYQVIRHDQRVRVVYQDKTHVLMDAGTEDKSTLP